MCVNRFEYVVNFLKRYVKRKFKDLKQVSSDHYVECDIPVNVTTCKVSTDK